MPENPTSRQETEAASDDVLAWKCHPSRRSFMRTTLVVVFLFVMLLFVAWYTGSLGFGIILTVVMFLSLSAYFFPTWYSLTADGVHVRTLVNKYTRPWATFRSHWPDKNGVLLSPFPYRSRLENFRGIFVRYEGNGADVLAYVKRYVGEPEAEE
jgi:hypothetical protein